MSARILPEMSSIKLETAVWAGVGLAALWLLHLLGPILAPFVLAAILAYICNPLVERLGHRLPQLLAVLVTMGLLAAALIAIGLLLTPLLRDESLRIVERLPALINVINGEWIPWVGQHLGIELDAHIAPEEIKSLVAAHWGNVQTVLGKIIGSALVGGRAAMQLLATLLLTPVVMFYLLHDWRRLLQSAENAVPRRWHAKAMPLLREVDRVLAEFLRGQVLVMLALALYYATGLLIAGVDFALPLGLLTGLLIFIPYLGYALGLTLALLTAFLQLQGWPPIIGVAVVYGIGQVLESFVLTPRLVGERIGLHPLAVIFALMAFGQLFGFFGVLVALPVSAALLVGLRHLREAYLASRFYTGEP
jgi:predicted PurR-regulated permease PerM